MKVIVTQEDIDAANLARAQGGYFSPEQCAIAKAVQRTYPGASVGSIGIYGGADTVGYMPQSALDWMRNFDTGNKVQPFEFETMAMGRNW